MSDTPATSPASFFSALDKAPTTWRHHALLRAASGGAFLGGFSVVALGGLSLPLRKHDFMRSPLLIGLMGSAFVLGAAASAWTGGLLDDKIGRMRRQPFSPLPSRRRARLRRIRALSAEVETGSAQESATKQEWSRS